MTEPTDTVDVLQVIRTVLAHGGGYTKAAAAVQPHLDAATARAVQAELGRDGAYRERAYLTAWLATIHPAVITPAPDVDSEGWQILYLTAGGRQLSWHIAPADAELYTHVEHVSPDDPRAQWDGHTTEQKYQAIGALTFGQLRGDTADHRRTEPCAHQDPKRLAARPGDLAVFCACGAQVMPGIRPADRSGS